MGIREKEGSDMMTTIGNGISVPLYEYNNVEIEEGTMQCNFVIRL